MDILIDDLRNPVLSETQRAGHAWGDANPVIFSEEAVLDHARKTTGLSDFGPDDFRERLGMLVDEWNADRGISNIHRHTLLSYVNRYAVNRLLIQGPSARQGRPRRLQPEAPLRPSWLQTLEAESRNREEFRSSSYLIETFIVNGSPPSDRPSRNTFT